MYKKAVFPGKYIQGAGALGELPGLIGLLGKRGLILASPTAKEKSCPDAASAGRRRAFQSSASAASAARGN